MSQLSLTDVDSVSEAERDTLAPLPPPAWANQFTNNPYGPSYVPPPPPGGYNPMPYSTYATPANDTASYVSMPGNDGSVHSGSGEAHLYVYRSTYLHIR